MNVFASVKTVRIKPEAMQSSRFSARNDEISKLFALKEIKNK